MNSATRAAVAFCLSRGHTPVAIHNGFPGLCRHHDDKPLGSVRELNWLDVEGWASKGGSEIGTNRGLPDEDIATTARCFELYRFDALFLIGGFEAVSVPSTAGFESVLYLTEDASALHGEIQRLLARFERHITDNLICSVHSAEPATESPLGISGLQHPNGTFTSNHK